MEHGHIEIIVVILMLSLQLIYCNCYISAVAIITIYGSNNHKGAELSLYKGNYKGKMDTSEKGQPLYKGQKGWSQSVPCSEVPLYLLSAHYALDKSRSSFFSGSF